jgi:hypothetical protein
MIFTKAGEVFEESRWPCTARDDWCGEWNQQQGDQ